MGLFNKTSPEHTDIPVQHHQRPSFKLCIPETLAASDTLLSSLPKKGNVLEDDFGVNSLIWLAQWKEGKREASTSFDPHPPSKVDKLLISLECETLNQEIYIIADLFFKKDQETGAATYIAKALGSYSSIPKMLSANFKHKGELVAETSYDTAPFIDVEIIPQGQNYEKRANFLFFWCEKRTILS